MNLRFLKLALFVPFVLGGCQFGGRITDPDTVKQVQEGKRAVKVRVAHVQEVSCRDCNWRTLVLSDKARPIRVCPICGWNNIEVKQKGIYARGTQGLSEGLIVVCPDMDKKDLKEIFLPFAEDEGGATSEGAK